MVLSPGQSTGGPENRHPEADQWCYVADGTGTAVVDGEEYRLRPGRLVLIEAGEAHEIRNDGIDGERSSGSDAGDGGNDDGNRDDRSDPLRTVSVYAPPAY